MPCKYYAGDDVVPYCALGGVCHEGGEDSDCPSFVPDDPEHYPMECENCGCETIWPGICKACQEDLRIEGEYYAKRHAQAQAEGSPK